MVALEQAAAVSPGDQQVQSRLAQARAAAAAERSAAAEAVQQQRAQPQPQPQASLQAPPVAPPPPPQQQQQPQQPQQPQNAQASSAVLRSLLGIAQPGGEAGGKAAAKRGGGAKGGARLPAPKAVAAPKPRPPKRVMWADEVEELEEEAPAAAPQPTSAVAADGAEAFAARGAAAFRVADFAAALSFYTEARLIACQAALMRIFHPFDASFSRAQALSVRPNDAQLLCNRSAAAHGLGLFDAAYADAIAAVEAAPERGKCHVRAGTAAAALRRWPEAAAAYERALVIMPGADDARQRLAMVQAAMMAETAASSRGEQSDATPSHAEEVHTVSTPPGLSPEPARASDSDGEHSIEHGSACVAAPVPAEAVETDADAAALAAALATAARCSDALSASAAALARRVAQLEAELAAARGARCGHCGRCGLASSS